MPFNGSGVYSVPIIMVNDAAGGIKILASRQDTQWADMVGAFNNCLTRDSQGKPSADWDVNTHKIINLSPGVNPTDAAQFQQIAAGLSEWIPESGTVAFVAVNQFKVVGVDHTSNYPAGRRVRVVNNTGGTVTYSTVVTSVFGVDTTVTVRNDTGNLVSTVTAVSYSILNSLNRSIPYGTFVKIYMNTATQALTANVEAKVGLDTLWQAFDPLAEAVLGSNRITLKQAGLYLLSGGIATLNPAFNTSLRGVIRLNGVTDLAYTSQSAMDLTGQNTLPFPAVPYLAVAGDFFELYATAEANINLAGTVNGFCFMDVIRIASAP